MSLSLDFRGLHVDDDQVSSWKYLCLRVSEFPELRICHKEPHKEYNDIFLLKADVDSNRHSGRQQSCSP